MQQTPDIAQQTPQSADPDRDRRTQADLVRLLYDQAPSGLAITSVNGFLVALGVSWVASPAAAWSWYAGLILVLAARTLLVVRYRRFPDAFQAEVWSRRFSLGAVATGLAWGLSPMLLPDDQLAYQVFLGFVIAGMVAGAVTSLSPNLWCYRAYLLAALVPFGLRLALFDDRLAHAFLLTVSLFGLFMWKNARNYRDTLRRSLELGHANLDLVEDLTRERDRISLLNRELEREVQERREIQEALVLAKEGAESANVAKSQFVANMSHEIRTPMNGVLGMLEMLAQTDLDSPQRGYVEIARSSAEGLLTVINDILDFSKIEAGKLDLESIPFDARAVAEDVASLFAASAEAKHIELACFVEPRVPGRVIGDPTRLRQVLTNVLGNAVKFTERGEVLLAVRDCPQRPGRTTLCFEATDTGIGMTQEQQGRLFTPFVQADGSTTRRFGGSGLGLSISKNLVELMGGTLEVESELGRGSRFLIRIPFAPQSPFAELPETRGLDGRRMLAVDDHPTNREILGHYLRGWGVRFAAAGGGEEALALLRAAAAEGSPFEVAILDLQMPGMDGLDLARAIRAEPTLGPIRLVLLSSGGQPAAADGRDLDMTLSKPVRQALLRDALFQLVHGLAARPAGAESEQPPPPLAGHVLLAEDNPINQKVACGMLRRLGLVVDVADDGAAALDRLDHGSYDAVLMDVQMPVMDGFAATRALRARERETGRGRVPVIAMTANAMTGDRELCLAAGMDDYIPKPVTLAELRRTLAQWVAPGAP
jgi:two-component system, sensor histidine kinase and response regulator